MKMKHFSFIQTAAILMMATAIVSCSDNDDLVIDNPGNNPEVITQPVTDVIETYLDGDIAVVGDHFDESTSYILSRVQGQKYSIGFNDAIPESVKILLLDDKTVQNITAEDIDNFIVPAYRRGITVCMHKPSDWKAAGILMGLWQVEWGEDGEDVADESLPMGAMPRTRATDDGMSDTDSSYDFWAMKPGGRTYQLTDIYTAGKQTTVTIPIVKFTEDGKVTEKDSVATVDIPEPTPYQYGLFAEETVKWLNETEEDVNTRATKAGMTGSGTPDDPITVVTNAYDYARGKYNNVINIVVSPLKISVWTSTMYNFDRDEDYYSVVVQEAFDAGKLYLGQIWSEGNSFTGWTGEAGFTWRDMEIRTRWPHGDFPLRAQYDILPQGKAAPIVTEEIFGWDASATVSVGLTGVSAKPGGSIKYEKKVTSVKEDVTLTNREGIDGNWMSWKYDFANQVYYEGTFGTPDLVSPSTNATSRSLSYQNQSWKWVVSNAKQRGTLPFTFDLKVASMNHTYAHAHVKLGFASVKNTHTDQLFLNQADFTFNLPVPQRCKHIYSFTTDEIGNLTEYNNLMTALRSVSTNFNSLYNKLIRLDDDGNPAGRTGVTYTALERMVGQEWYALANEVQGKKIAVEKTYKFYVKDENGNLLKMVKCENWQYKQMGTYLVIGPDGISIEGVKTIGYNVGDLLKYSTDYYDITFIVTKKKEEVALMKVPAEFSGVLTVPSSVDGLKVTGIRKQAVYNCPNLTGIQLPTSLNSIEPYAFRGLDIGSLEFPEGLHEIPEWAVVSCDKLRKLVIPSTVSKIGINAFLSDPALREVHVKAKTPPTIVGSIFLPFNSSTTEQGKLYVPKGSLNAYKEDEKWGEFAPNGFVNIVEE